MDELNDKQVGKIKKKSKWLCNNLGSEREVPRFKPYSDKEFRDFDTSKTPFEPLNKKKCRKKTRITQVI